MDTSIGRAFRHDARIARLGVLLSLMAIAVDFALVKAMPYREQPRFILAGIAILLLLVLSRGKPASLGLTHRVEPGFRYWVKMTLIIGTAVGAFCLIVLVVMLAVGAKIPSPTIPPDRMLSALWFCCVTAPLLEEPIYRLVLCAPLAAAAGPRPAIVVSGCLFAVLHFVYGNPGPDNFIAGFFLAWAYLRSGSIIIPLLLHSLGNAVAVSSQLINWHLAG